MADKDKNTGPAPDQDPFWLEHRDSANRTHFGRRPSNRESAREDLLRSWYGEEEARLEIAARRRPARPVGVAVGKILDQFELEPALLLTNLIQVWPELVGADVAKHSRPAAVQDNRLQIEVFDAPWRYVLETMHKKALQAKIRDFTASRIAEIQFVTVGRRPDPDRTFPRKPDPPAGRSP